MTSPNYQVPVIVRRALNGGKAKVKLYFAKTWFKVGILAVLGSILLRNDISFQLNIGNVQSEDSPQSASLINTVLAEQQPKKVSKTPKATPKRVERPTDASPKPPIPAPNKNKPSPPATADIANVATAVGAGLTEEQKDIAEQISNLTFILNPTYARRHNIPQEVVKHKIDICLNYIIQFAPVAREAAEKYNIPVSITLAQGLLESNAGESTLARRANNHFGIKCFSKTCHKGHCINLTDDSHKDFFVAFKKPEDGFRHRSTFLQKDRYAHLGKLSLRNYRAWATGLQEAGYATDPNYAKKLITIIERLQLYRLDRR